MEAGLRTRRMQEVDRSWRLYRGLCEVAEVAFLRAGSHGRALVSSHHPRRVHTGFTPTGFILEEVFKVFELFNFWASIQA